MPSRIATSRAYEEGFAYDLTIPFGALRSIWQTLVRVFGGWEFAQLAAATGGGMLGVLVTHRGALELSRQK